MPKKNSSSSNSKARKEESSPSGTSAAQSCDELSFEAALADLEQVVASLEGGDLSLQESLETYERGIARLRVCHQRLAEAERRITVLTGFDADGNPVLSPLDACDDDGDLQQKQNNRAQRRGVQRSGSPKDDDPDALF